MIVGGSRHHPATGRALDESAPQQERFDFVFEGVGGDVHGVGNCIDARRSAREHAHQRFQVPPVLAFQAKVIDFQHPERVVR